MVDKTQLHRQELIAESAHALRGLVGTILNNAGFIVRGINPDFVIEDAREIHAAAKSLALFVDTVVEILECSNKEYNWIAADIAELVEETCFKLQANNLFGFKEYKRPR